MPLQFNSAIVVVRGKFNPYIFSPEWLEEQKIWSDKSVQLALGVLGDGVNFRSGDGEITWRVDPLGLTVEAAEPAPIVIKVLERLPHTPVTAVGCNFTFSSETWNGPLPRLGELKLSDISADYSPELAIWTGVFHIETVRIKMVVATGDEGATVSFNFHQNVSTTDQAIAAANQFKVHSDRSVEMIREFLEETVSWQ